MVTAGARLRVEVLGPIRVVDADGTDLTPSGTLQRRLLALLVLRRGTVVSADEAVEVLWPGRPSRDSAAALHNQVFRLRRRLPTGVVGSSGDGYLLSAASVELDADELAALVHAADPGAAALDGLGALLARWQGAAYPELADVDDGRAEASRLDELRTGARERLAECRLAAGDVDAVLPELGRLVEEHPLRERPRSLLMTALDRAGRRVEALRAYDDFRRRLGDELGIEPSPALAAQHAALLGSAVPPPAAVVAVDRLPVPPTSLVGREELVEEAVAALGRHRVVTLVGPAGVGKTRLGIEVGHRLRSDERPVVLSELGAVAPQAVVEHVAADLAIDPRAEADLADRITEVLGERPLLALLDGCEHALDPVAALVARLVARCPAVSVLVTSQERLRLPGERVLSVPPLPAGDEQAAGVRLFVERARAAAPGFEPSAAEVATVAEVVRRLDGLPLAIELAAARLHTHDLDEVAAGLDERFSLLSSGYRTSVRHASLRTAVTWSYDLLDRRLRHVFADLSVFAGAFSVADAGAVCGLDPPVSRADLAQLVERSLLARAGGGRYGLLETLRAFGAEQLAAVGRQAAARERHARYFVAWAEDADRRLLDGGAGVVTRIDAAVPDLRAALEWLLAEGRLELAARLVVSLRDYGFLRQRPDVLTWAARVADDAAADADADAAGAGGGRGGRATDVGGTLLARVWGTSVFAAWMVGDTAGTAARVERARALADGAGGELAADVAMICGSHALFEGRLEDAVTWYRRATELATASGDAAEQLLASSSELLALGYAGDGDTARRADAVLAAAGDALAADSPYAAYALYCAGEADLGVDDTRARDRLTRAMELAERTGASLVLGVAGASRASIDARFGDPEAAVAAYRWLIPHWRRAGVWPTQWTMLRSIASLLDRLGRRREAAVLEGAVRSAEGGHRIFGVDEAALAALGARLRDALGDDAYEAARREGARLDGAAAADFALAAL